MKQIKKHRDFIKYKNSIIESINRDPKKSRLFLANPILALEEEGYKIGKDMKSHIKNNIKFRYISPRLYKRIKDNDCKLPWVKHIQFEIEEE